MIWRNPKLHTAARRKVWTACEVHHSDLASFLDLRGFLIEVIDVRELQPERDG